MSKKDSSTKSNTGSKAQAQAKKAIDFKGLEVVEKIPEPMRAASGRTTAILEAVEKMKKGDKAKVLDFTAAGADARGASSAALSLNKASEKRNIKAQFSAVAGSVYVERG